jgi:Tfp pilus assembly protein PilO
MLFRERQQLTICVITAVIVGGFVLFRYLPLRNRMKAVRQIKSAQALTIAKGIADNRQLVLLKEKLSKLQHRLENYEANIPMNSDIGEFLHTIADLMNKHSLGEQVIEPRKEIEAHNINCIPVKMQCTGRLIQIFEFYRELQELDRLVRIEQVKLSNDRNFTGRIGMEARAIIYYRTKIGQG